MKIGPGMKLEKLRQYPHGKSQLDDVPPEDFGEAYWFWCPGCSSPHQYRTKVAKGEQGPTWSFNGNMEKPSFIPSLLCRWYQEPKEGAPGKDMVCHFYLTEGQLVFQNDCTHAFSGTTVPLGTLP